MEDEPKVSEAKISRFMENLTTEQKMVLRLQLSSQDSDVFAHDLLPKVSVFLRCTRDDI